MTRFLPVLALLGAVSCPYPRPNPPPTTTTTTSTTTVPPAPNVCRAPQGVEWTAVVDGESVFAEDLNKAMARLTRCDVGSPCTHGYLDQIAWESAGQAEKYVLEERAAQGWMGAVVKALRDRGLCAGQVIDGHSDGVVVGKSCGGIYTEYKIANYGGGKVIWSPNADRGSYVPAGGRCDGGPLPTPPPAACPLVLDEHHFLEIRIKVEPGARVRLDATPFFCGFPVPENWACGTRCCGVGVDYGAAGLACEAELFGQPVWNATGQGQSLQATSNPFTVIVFGKGEVTACSSKHPEFCGTYKVE